MLFAALCKMKLDPQSLRKAALAKIHIAKSQLAMEDADYRAVLMRVAGVKSAADLTPRQIDAVLAEFRRLGFVDRANPRQPSAATPFGKGAVAARPYARQGNEALMRRIEKNLSAAMLPWTYAEAMSKRMFGIERLQWLGYENLRKLNAALEIAQRRRDQRVSANPRPSPTGTPFEKGAC